MAIFSYKNEGNGQTDKKSVRYFWVILKSINLI